MQRVLLIFVEVLRTQPPTQYSEWEQKFICGAPSLKYGHILQFFLHSVEKKSNENEVQGGLWMLQSNKG